MFGIFYEVVIVSRRGVLPGNHFNIGDFSAALTEHPRVLRRPAPALLTPPSPLASIIPTTRYPFGVAQIMEEETQRYPKSFVCPDNHAGARPTRATLAGF